MKSATAICFLALVAFATAEKYTDRFDNVNIQEILSNRRLLIAYIGCCLGKAKCTPEGLELKSHLTEALENNCAKCTEAQRKGTKVVITHLINYEPGYWQELVDKYDPQRKYTARYEKELRSIKS